VRAALVGIFAFSPGGARPPAPPLCSLISGPGLLLGPIAALPGVVAALPGPTLLPGVAAAPPGVVLLGVVFVPGAVAAGLTLPPGVVAAWPGVVAALLGLLMV
jgi:hypothetical protein